MKRACFAGSFDPFTKGHEDVVRRGLGLFDEVVIAIGQNSTKSSYFSLESRIAHIRSLFSDTPQVKVEQIHSLTVDFCREQNCTHILRGLRDVKDFLYEQPILYMNRDMSGIETVFVMPAAQLLALNSTIIREIYKNGGMIDSFVTNTNLLVKNA